MNAVWIILLSVSFNNALAGTGRERVVPDNESFTRRRTQERGKGHVPDTPSQTRIPSSKMAMPSSNPAASPTTIPLESPMVKTTSMPSNAAPIVVNPTADPPRQAVPPTLPPERCNVDVSSAIWQGLGPPFDSSATFDQSNSYQCQALKRVAAQDGFEDFDFRTTMKYWVLYCIHFATNGNDNIFDAGVKQDEASTWISTEGWQRTDLDPCDGWFGISCDTRGRVTEVRLARNGLTGTFPREVSYLASSGSQTTGAGALQVLELYNNADLTNSPSSVWISELGADFRVLNYGSTGFKGSLPTLPTHIEEFDCSYALHVGGISTTAFDGLDQLRMLILDGNNFGSAIPRSVATLPNLEFFYCREASITGDLSYMQGMPAIVEHLVDGNSRLGGPIYSFIGELTTLRSFSASDCGLTGELPKELGNLADMTQLWLYGNPVSGQIPSEYAQMSQLRILALEDTNLTGRVPIDVCLQRFSRLLTTLSTDCDDKVDCTGFFPNCCTCCGSFACGT